MFKIKLKRLLHKLLFFSKLAKGKIHRNYVYPTNRYIRRRLCQTQSIDFTDIGHITPVEDDYTFVFVCQAGYLEISALLLAASLKKNLDCKYEIVAAIPLPERIMGSPDPRTIALLKDLDVRVFYFENEMVTNPRIVPDLSLLEKKDYITNKMYCLGAPVNTEKIIYIDTGYLCIDNFTGDAGFSLPFSGLKVFYEGVRYYQGLWHKLYRTCQVPMPNLRMKVEGPAKDRDQVPFTYVPPSFNSGFFVVDKQLARELSEYWFDCWKKIDSSNLINHRKYNIDQLSIAIAVSKLGVPFKIIEPEWLKQYFAPIKLVRPKEDVLLKVSIETLRLISSLINEYPYIAERMNQEPKCNAILEVMKERLLIPSDISMMSGS